jgi:hypothetical protein
MATISSCHGSIDPLCIFSVYTFFINTIMDLQCILWWPYLTSLDHPSIGMPALGLKRVTIFVGCLCVAFVRFFASIPLLESLQSISVISSCLLTSYFGGQSVTHQKYSL